MTLVQYRQSLYFYFLAHLFCLSTTTCNDNFKEMTKLLLVMLDDSLNFMDMDDFTEEGFASWPDKLACFADFPKCVLVADCTEIYTECPDGSVFKKIFFSFYKHHNTCKMLIFIDVRGNIVYCSPAYAGRISDTLITALNEKVFLKLWKKAGVMIDKGFSMKEIVKKYEIDIVIPPRVNIDKKFSADELNLNREIAKSRIHVERAIRRAKVFRILHDVVAIAMVPNYGDVARVCFYLSNYVGPLVIQDDDDD